MPTVNRVKKAEPASLNITRPKPSMNNNKFTGDLFGFHADILLVGFSIRQLSPVSPPYGAAYSPAWGPAAFAQP